MQEKGDFIMLVTTIDNGYQLEQLFNECGRGDHFSYEGYNALYDYLDQLSDDIGEDFKIDVIALCCDFTEYSDWEEIFQNYSYSYNNESETWENINQDDFKEWVQDRTQVIEVFDYKNCLTGVIIQCF